MAAMRTLVLHEWGGRLEPAELPIPRPRPGEVLLRVSSCGVGDTLNNMRSGRNASMPGASLPRVIGHEVAGSIVEKGPEVEGLDVGQRVYVYMYLTCGQCDACRWGHDPLCVSLRGIVGLASDGGFAEYMAVPAANVGPLPDEVTDLDACVAVDAVATPWHALRSVAHLDPTHTLVVVGAGGGVGVHAVKVGKLLGAEVIGVEVTDEKLAFAREQGADEVVDGRDDWRDAIADLTRGRGADVVLDYVSSAATLHTAFAALAPAGKLIIQGVNPEGDEFKVEPRSFIHRQLSVSGSRYASRREVAESIELVRRRLVAPAITRTASLQDAETLFELLAERALLGRAALVFNSATAGDTSRPER
jgi:D-arabinose 1-dehydrogenase-like Zn-dependent alcohol dehydrogenase